MKYLILIAALIFSKVSAAQTFTPQDQGSKIHFVIKNFGINTGGDLSGVQGKIIFDAKKPAAASFDVTVNVSTIDTDNGKRDEHLKSDDYFDTEKYPVMHIVSTSITKGTDLMHFNFTGKLTIKNVTKTISFPFTAQGKTGGAIFAGNFEIDRVDYGVGKESSVMSDKVKISLSVFAKAG